MDDYEHSKTTLMVKIVIILSNDSQNITGKLVLLIVTFGFELTPVGNMKSVIVLKWFFNSL